jgi:hypothetical protein
MGKFRGTSKVDNGSFFTAAGAENAEVSQRGREIFSLLSPLLCETSAFSAPAAVRRKLLPEI